MAEISDYELTQLRRLAEAAGDSAALRRRIAFWSFAGLATLVGVYFLFRLVVPQLNLYKANTEREIEVREARAHRDAAVLLAEAEVNRSRGVAEANSIVAETLTDRYITWLYVDQMDQLQGEVIYIPTEGGIPILEAGRSVHQDETP